jgi:hypothetical protein
VGRLLRQKKRVDYAKVAHKYDRYDFKTKPRPPKVVRAGFAGRAHAAPPITAWTGFVPHADVEYSADIANDLHWLIPQAPNDVRLPFTWLDVNGLTKWQGLIQTVPMGGNVRVRAHFDAITDRLRNARSNPPITEAVGEAAAAIGMLALGGWEMIWGFDTHAGTGIDQIWRQTMPNGLHNYRIVEAKGPGATLNPGIFVPPGYAQMEAGWVFNHLAAMARNNHAAGLEVVNSLGLTFNTPYPNYGGASKSYQGMASHAPHAANRLSGQVYTANWLADGRLSYVASAVVQYI